MNATYKEINKLPVLIIDDFFTKDEEILILKELEFLTPKLLNPSETGSAKDENGNLKKRNNALFLDNAYADRNISDVLRITHKFFSKENLEYYAKHHSFFEYIKLTNIDTTLVSYYEHSDSYSSHHDVAILTALFWFYKEPKSFDGGDLKFNDEVLFECKSNRFLLFPSIIKHEVLPVLMKENDLNQCKGRYTISKFMTINF